MFMFKLNKFSVVKTTVLTLLLYNIEMYIIIIKYIISLKMNYYNIYIIYNFKTSL